MRTGCGMDGGARGENLLSYDRAVRNHREVIGKIWFSDYRLGEAIEQAADISSSYISLRDVKSGSAALILFRARFVDRFIADKTISARKSHDKRWNRGNYHAISIIRTNSATSDTHADICARTHMYIRNYRNVRGIKRGSAVFFQKPAIPTSSRIGAIRGSCRLKGRSKRRSRILRSAENRLSRDGDRGARRHTE